jgi:drug/metabolite transporter (DMT)-like permease
MGIWLAFWTLGLIWGSSFMLIRIGVEAIHPLHLVLIRVGVAAIFLGITIVALRRKLPKDWRTWGAIALVGIGNNALPFTLIAWGEQTIESGLASVLQSTAALFGLVVAHFAFKDERITPQKVVGLIMGFLGIVVLASRNWQDGEIITGGLMGQLAIVGASVCYATFTTLSRKIIQADIAPVVLAAIAMMSATFFEAGIIFVGSLVADTPLHTPVDLAPDVLLAVLALGFVNTYLAYLLFYNIVRVLGVARATMVTYVVPVVGLLLGIIFLNELLDVYIVVGATMIFMGIGVVNLRYFQRLNTVFLRRPAISGD